jgi:tetratricopeptide (TPR) repeat protein
VIRKIPAALAVVAVLLVTIALAATATRGNPSPDPGPTSRSTRGALVSTTMKTPEEQVAFWQARVDANPTDYLSTTSLGNSLLSLAKASGDLALYPEAEAVFGAALALNPEHPAALLGLGAARGAQHDFGTQLALAERVLATDPDDESARVAVADAKLELGDPAAAEDTYHALAGIERSAPIASRLAKTAWLRGDTAEAVRLSEEAIDLSAELELAPEQASYYFFQLATFSYRDGDIERARRAVDRSVEIDPENLGALELEPKVSIAEGDLSAATAGYEELLEISPAADLHGELAKLYAATGRHAEAQQQIEIGLALGRSQVGLYPAERRHLADFFGTYDPALALTLAQEDIATRQDVGAFDTLAWALHQNGRHAEARETIMRALDTGIRDTAVYFHAGMIEDALGNDSGARALFERALDINPHFDVNDAQTAREMLGRSG